MKVLIVDTSQQIVPRLEEILLASGPGLTVYSSCSHENARMLLVAQQPDIVLLGINLPENESLQLLIQIKYIAPATTVIVLSANINPLFHEQCRLQGAHYFLDKYYEFEKIPGIISTITTGRQKLACEGTGEQI